MRTKSMLGRCKGLMLGLTLVPAFFVAEYLGPEGIPEAHGCSGASGLGVAPFPGVQPYNPLGTSLLSVATDGFFLLTTTGFLGEYPAQSVTVTVETTSGDVVPGKLSQLENGMLAWEADVRLAIGTRLTALAQVAGAPGATTVRLEVAGEPAKLENPAISFGGWVDFRHGIGEVVSCQDSAVGPCGTPLLLRFPGDEEVLLAVRVEWAPPAPIHGFVAWVAHVELPNGAPQLGSQQPQYLFGASQGPVDLGALVFPQATIDHCAVLVVRDLRSGLEQRSELCAEPEAPVAVERDTPLSSCSSPPTPESQATRAWCELHPGVVVGCTTGGGGTGGRAPIAKDPRPDDRLIDGNPTGTGPDADAERHSSACQVTAVGARSGGLGALLGLLAFAVWRRRRG